MFKCQAPSDEVAETLSYAIKVLDAELSQKTIAQEYYDEHLTLLCNLDPAELEYWATQMSQGVK